MGVVRGPRVADASRFPGAGLPADAWTAWATGPRDGDEAAGIGESPHGGPIQPGEAAGRDSRHCERVGHGALPTRNDAEVDPRHHEAVTDRDVIDYQIQIVLATFRYQLAQGTLGWKALFRARAQELLDPLDARAVGHPDLQDALSAARQELGLVRTAV